jgi:hypothetical protein
MSVICNANNHAIHHRDLRQSLDRGRAQGPDIVTSDLPGWNQDASLINWLTNL